MKLVEKNGYQFATGMFWQIPDEGKKMPNLARIIKDTGNDMYCVINNLRPTFGFCQRADLSGHKHIASLGKFIVDASQLNANYANSIICYKFKSAGELDEHGRSLASDQYGYIVILNGTICPCDGEYVADFSAVKNSVIERAIAHPIDAMYLTCDVAAKFLNIFERLNHALGNDALLGQIMNEEQPNKLTQLREFMLNHALEITQSIGRANYAMLLAKLEQRIHNQVVGIVFTLTDIAPLSTIVASLEFIQVLKNIAASDNDKHFRYLIANVIQLPFTSDELYWRAANFKRNVTDAYLHPITDLTTRKYKIALLLLILVACTYIIYSFAHKKAQPKLLTHTIVPARPAMVPAANLIAKCLIANDRFFKDLHPWTFSQMQCNSLGFTLTFIASRDTTINELMQLVGESHDVLLNGRTGTWSRHYHLMPINNAALQQQHSQVEIINNLQQASENYNLHLTLQHPLKPGTKHRTALSFTIVSNLSPVYLQQHQVFSGSLLSTIAMTFSSSTGFYTWKISGIIL